MNRSFKITILLFTVLWVTSCSSQSIQLIEANQEYKREIRVFGESFVDHFPAEMQALPFRYVVSEDITESHPGVWLKFKVSKDKIASIERQAMEKSEASYNVNDSCLLVIDNHLTEENAMRYDKTQRRGPVVESIDSECHTGKLPVPKFWSDGWIETKDSQTGLKNGYKLYVLEAKPGVFMDESKLPNGKYTPSGWQHGYTKGIAINKEAQTIIYWFDIW